MAKKLYEESAIKDIANAIREKNGSTTKYKVAEMGDAVRALSASETVEWHQCPEPVRNYLANVTYDPNDYSTSQISDYAPATNVVSNYKPIGQTAGGVIITAGSERYFRVSLICTDASSVIATINEAIE